MKKLLNGLAVLMICLGLGMGALCLAAVFLPQQETLRPVRTTEEAEVPETGENTVTQQEEEEAEQEPPPEESSPATGNEPSEGLAYGLLDADAQGAYTEMLDVIERHGEETELSTLDESVLPRAFEALTCDHGEIFWISGYRYVKESMGDRITKLRFQPVYTMTLDERTEYQEQVDRAAATFLYGADENSSDYEKTKAVYENLVWNVKYNEEAAENQNILSVFLGGQSVCNGIAASAQYLLTSLDVPCMIVYGHAGEESHAWNLAVIDGAPYFLDATWGNNATAVLGDCSYEYLNLTGVDLAATHTADMRFSLPECTATEANYFVREGRYFEAFDEAAAGAALKEQYEQGERTAALRFADMEAYEQAKQAFIGEGRLAEYCTGITSFRYMENEDLHVLTFGW